MSTLGRTQSSSSLAPPWPLLVLRQHPGKVPMLRPGVLGPSLLWSLPVGRKRGVWLAHVRPAGFRLQHERKTHTYLPSLCWLHRTVILHQVRHQRFAQFLVHSSLAQTRELDQSERTCTALLEATTDNRGYLQADGLGVSGWTIYQRI